MIKNLCPHDVTWIDSEGKIFETFKASPEPARMAEQENFEFLAEFGIPVYSSVLLRGNLPEEEKGTFFIVSSVVALANKERDDLLVPFKFVRDVEGNILGCQAFKTYY